MFSHLSADVWFVFGSFVYGFEGSIRRGVGDSLEIQLVVPASDTSGGIDAFLDELTLNSRGLIKSQVSLYRDEPGAELSNSPLVELFTDLAPKTSEGMPVGVVVLHGLRGVTHHDNTMWQKLVAGEWSQT